MLLEEGVGLGLLLGLPKQCGAGLPSGSMACCSQDGGQGPGAQGGLIS